MKTNTKLAKIIIRAITYALAIAASYFLLNSVFSSYVITVEINWLKLLIAVAIIGVASILCHLYPNKKGGNQK